MVRIVERDYLLQLIDQYYNEQEENCLSCGSLNCLFCRKSLFLEEQLRKKKLTLGILMSTSRKYVTTKVIQVF